MNRTQTLSDTFLFEDENSQQEGCIVHGDIRTVAKKLRPMSVQCIITSPPYWGLRDYEIRGQLGLERSVNDYVFSIASSLTELKFALKDDGVLWLNVGDSYTSGNRKWRASDKKNPARAMNVRPDNPDGYKNKDLIGVPWLLSQAMRRFGWYFRSDIIWNKPNAMPESVKDRPNRSHEYLFLFSKTEKYYFDREAIRENEKRYKRTVWNINTQPVKNAHFATFPEALVEPCILSSTKMGDVVLDPFFGSGTIALTANRLKRNWIGVELNQKYVEIADARLKNHAVHFSVLEETDMNNDEDYDKKPKFELSSPDRQIAFSIRLKEIKRKYLQQALANTVRSVDIAELDAQLSQYTPKHALAILASKSLRGEILFPTPLLLQKNPNLIGYYRMVLGYSQKEFYQSATGFHALKSMEEKGKISPSQESILAFACQELIRSASILLFELDDDDIERNHFHELSLLTLGANLRGSHNTLIGAVGTKKVFNIMKNIVAEYIISSSETQIIVESPSNARTIIEFASDPDIVMYQSPTSGSEIKLVAIEIKAGTDGSNIHNRIGEAEKSHQKAKANKYFNFWTIINTPGVSEKTLRSESPTTNHFFQLSEIEDPQSDGHLEFRRQIESRLGLPFN